MNIAVLCYPSYGGSGIIATELGLELGKRGFKVHFINYDTPIRLKHFSQNIFYHEATNPSYPLFKYNPYTLSLTCKLIEIIRTEDIDIIHAHYAIPYSVCAFLAKSTIKNKKIKTVTTLHGTDITLVGLEQSFYEMVRFSIENSDKVTCVSEFLKNATIKDFEIQKEIDVIHNFVDIDEFKPLPNKNFENTPKKIIHISNFREPKNVQMVIKTFNEIQKEIDARLLLVGDGPTMSDVRKLARSLDLCSKIDFLGKVDAIDEILPETDLFILPSRKESFGLALLEAMSCGIPTISSNIGGLPEVVDKAETGFLFAPDDYIGMARKSIEILKNPDAQKQMYLRCREKVVKSFDKNLIVPKYIELYQSLCEK